MLLHTLNFQTISKILFGKVITPCPRTKVKWYVGSTSSYKFEQNSQIKFALLLVFNLDFGKPVGLMTNLTNQGQIRRSGNIQIYRHAPQLLK